MPTIRDDKILELANQLTYSPAEKRREQLAGIVALATAIDSAKSYPWDFIHFRITSFQARGHSEHIIPGDILQADLSALAEFLSSTLALTVEEVVASGDAVMELEGVARKFSVSSKTIQRWRKQGLIGLRYVHADGRRRLGFRESAVVKFAADNRELVDRSAAFRQLSDEERRQIIDLAKGIAATGRVGMKELAHHVARLVNRAPETIRYTIRNYDREHPEAAIFVEEDGAVLPRRAGEAAGQGVLFEDSPAAAQSAAGQGAAAPSAPVEQIAYTANPLFEHPDAATIILHVLPAEAVAQAQATISAGTNAAAADVYMARVPGGLPAYLAGIFAQPVMPRELEIDAFRRMNYLKYRAAQVQAGLDLAAPDAGRVAEIEGLLQQAHAIKNQILQNNLRVAVHVARKHQRPDRPLMELVSDATIWLMRAIEKYDFARPTRFTTYAGLAIMKNFARERGEQISHRDARLVTGQQEALNALGEREPAVADEALDAAHWQAHLQHVIDELPERERELLRCHYGLGRAAPALSLAQIGDKLGITKARVRQLEARALRRLRHLMEARQQKLRDASRKAPR